MEKLTDSIGYNLTPEDIQYYKKIKREKIIHIVFQTIIYIFLTFWALLAIMPVVWTAINSFKTRFSIVSDPFALPFGEHFALTGYKKAFTGRVNIGLGYLNSLLISGSVVIGTIICAVLAAFVMARYNFPGKKFVYFLVIACMMFPAFSLLFPIIRLLANIKLYNNQFGVVLVQIALNLGFTVVLLMGFFQGLPLEVEESAYMDGASVFRVLFQIMIPMARSAIITCVIFIFIWSYNDLFMQLLIIVDARKFPIALLLNDISTNQSYGYEYDKMAAGSTLVCIPVIILYCFLQRHIIKGLTAGAVKG